MKKILASLSILLLLGSEGSAQTTSTIRRQSLGFSVIANDFITAQRIRSSSLSSVLREKQFLKSDGLSYGFAVNYIKGFTPIIDFAATLGASFSAEPNFAGRANAGENTLLELDASAHFKMFTESAVVNPYLIGGIGVSKFTNVYGAFIPLGGGIKFRMLDEAEFHTQFQYRVPVTTDANNYHFQINFGISGLF